MDTEMGTATLPAWVKRPVPQRTAVAWPESIVYAIALQDAPEPFRFACSMYVIENEARAQAQIPNPPSKHCGKLTLRQIAFTPCREHMPAVDDLDAEGPPKLSNGKPYPTMRAALAARRDAVLAEAEWLNATGKELEP